MNSQQRSVMAACCLFCKIRTSFKTYNC